MASRYEIAKHWYPEYVADLGEPSCFACGYFLEKWDDHKGIKARWDTCELERCHVIPESLGGKADPSNLVLLCRRCHASAPDTIDAEFMHRWIKARHRTFLNGIELAELQSLLSVAELDQMPRKIVTQATIATVESATVEGMCMHFGKGYSLASMVWSIKKKAQELLTLKNADKAI